MKTLNAATINWLNGNGEVTQEIVENVREMSKMYNEIFYHCAGMWKAYQEPTAPEYAHSAETMRKAEQAKDHSMERSIFFRQMLQLVEFYAEKATEEEEISNDFEAEEEEDIFAVLFR
jgi:hypothetical protein